MDKRKTTNSIAARRIADEVRDLPLPFSRTYEVANGSAVRNTLKQHLRGSNIKISLRGNTLVVSGARELPREAQLVEMVRKLALHVDDEDLYDEARRLVRTI